MKKNPAVFIHGDLQNHTIFNSLKKVINDLGHDCFTVDMPGHGLSEFSEKTRDLTNFITKTLKDKNIKNPLLIGHSSGALLSLEYARKTGNTSGLILINPLITNPKFIFPNLDLKSIFENYKDMSRKNYVSQKLVDYSKEDVSSDQKIKELGLKNTDPRGFENNINFYFSHENKNNLFDLKIPTLIIASGDDHVIPIDFLKNSIRGLSNVKLTEITGGHNSLLKNPKDVISAIKNNYNYFL